MKFFTLVELIFEMTYAFLENYTAATQFIVTFTNETRVK
jgi:hypothetical protein